MAYRGRSLMAASARRLRWVESWIRFEHSGDADAAFMRQWFPDLSDDEIQVVLGRLQSPVGPVSQRQWFGMRDKP